MLHRPAEGLVRFATQAGAANICFRRGSTSTRKLSKPSAVTSPAATSSNSAVDMSAFKNTDGTVAIVALNTGTSADPITYSLSGTGTPNGATVTPYLTNSASDVAAQAATSLSGGSFSASVPARSLVTYVVGTTGTTGNTVTVTNPGNQTGAVGTPASLQIKATDSASGQTLSYAATGLPAGLSISSAGLISGTPTTAATGSTTVTAKDTTGAPGSATFSWTVNSAGSGEPAASFWGNTSAIPAAQPASIAFPPASRIENPAAAAR